VGIYGERQGLTAKITGEEVTRYVLERVAGNPVARRIKDKTKGKYVKLPHGSDVWQEQAARIKAAELNNVAGGKADPQR
jgi:hypothetical protein